MVDVEFRTMTLADVDFYRRLIDMTGWGLDARDFERMLSYEPDGGFIASLHGEDVGMVASFLYGEVGWIGNLVTLPERRGRGVGAALMRKAIDRLQTEGAKSVRLDAVAKAVPLYERLGFRPEHRSLRFIGTGHSASSGGASPMRPEDLDEVIGLDVCFFGLRRERMLRRVLRNFPRLCFVSRKGGRIVGYIMAKEGSESLRVGPWICDPENVEEAEDLLHAVMNKADGKRVWVGVPEGNRMSVGILRSNGFDELPSSLRMCLGTCTTVEDTSGIFGIGAAEKG
jgi:GNAT superfamily N-acetyltransferase